jgi:hypothetical protein
MSRLRTIGRHIVLLIVLLVVLSAVAIWLGLGPKVHSEGAAVQTARSN